jgi:hypothetical protein
MRTFLASPITGVVCTVPLIMLLTTRQFVDMRRPPTLRQRRTRWEYPIILSELLCVFGIIVVLRFLKLSF